MNRKLLAAVSAALAITTFGAVTLAQEKPAPRRPMMESQGQGMQGMQGMMGMMDMMQGCQSMMGGQGAGRVPRLPPGNEKLQAQMWGEIMQRTGEIVSKYAGQAKP